MEMQKSRTGKALAIIGMIFQAAAPFVFLGSILGLMQTFMAPQGPFDPPVLPIAIGKAILYLAFAAGLGLAGLVLICVALLHARYRAEWFLWFLLIDSVLIIALFPVGTAFAIFFLVYGYTRRGEFLRPSPINPTQPTREA